MPGGTAWLAYESQAATRMSGLPALYAYRLVVRGREEEQRQARPAAFAKHLAAARRVEAPGRMRSALPSQIESLFARHPALCGFSLRGREQVPDNCPRSEDDDDLYVGDIGVSPPLPQQEFGEIFDDIVAAVGEMLAEAPGAGEYLRGRTFARALH